MEENKESKENMIKVTGYSDKRIFMLQKKGRIYTKEDIENILLKLTDIDIKSKSGYDIAYMFKEFLIEL
jgi:DNA polymerase III delta subunit